MSVSSPTVSGGPVVFDPYSDDYFDSPFETYRRMRDEAPLYYSEKYDFWALTRYDDVSAAIRDHETFSSAKGVTLDIVKAAAAGQPDSATGKIIISLDPPEHERMRKLVNRVFTPRAVTALESLVRETIDRYVNAARSVVVRRGRRFRGAVPGRGHHLDARCARRRQATAAALARQGSRARRGHRYLRPRAWTRSCKSAAYYYDLIQERRAKTAGRHDQRPHRGGDRRGRRGPAAR